MSAWNRIERVAERASDIPLLAQAVEWFMSPERVRMRQDRRELRRAFRRARRRERRGNRD